LTILLDALVGIGLLAKRDGKYQCLPSISAVLSADNPDSVLPLVLHMAHVWERWSGLTSVVRGSQAPEKPAAPPEAEATRVFIGALHVILVECPKC